MDRSVADQNLIRRPHCSGVSTLGQAGRIQPPNVSELPPARFTLAPPLTGLTYGLQVIEGLHRARVEFRSLSEDFDTSTATSKLQLAIVLAFSEWWRNSVRERSKGVSQRELAKLLEVSRWTIQQVNG